ncbi:hypothetical protein [Chryseobacterium sp. JUb7]|uniref:hypothetical protein n=1 Tax=Chryseobacterium sp. JUb7 TaxID=2940599 RepID=UPI00216AAD61|nr:hypothetical protein [Chryseobacterium sp. JUb7]MCS3532212.1 preprotein translocase subunit SecE [Chryseobacterium sp. JUb7]
MLKKIKIDQSVSIYSSFNENSKTLDSLNEGQIVNFNREKRRNQINWMEIYFQGKKAYIKKDFSKICILRRARLLDNSCTVIFYEAKDDKKYKFGEIFTSHQFDDLNQGSVKMKRIYDEAQKEKTVNLYYNKTKAEVSKRIFAKGEELIIARDQGGVLEVLYGKKFGYILSDVAYYEARNWWIIAVAVLVVLGIIAGSFYALIDNGWTITGKILLIPAIVITLIIVVFIKFILAIFDIIFQNLRKRF